MQGEARAAVEAFQYPAGPAPPPVNHDVLALFSPRTPDTSASLRTAEPQGTGGDRGTTSDAAALQTSFETGRRQGIEEGRAIERAAGAAARATEEHERARQRTSLLETFAVERDKYLHAVEHEVATLALAIAARILRREAQMDPLFLTGAVRVALGQLAGTTKVAVRVPRSELGLWQEAIAHLPHRTLQATVVAGDAMGTGECVLETELGSVDLGLGAQLREIERGFFGNASSGHAESEPASPPVSRMVEEEPQ